MTDKQQVAGKYGVEEINKISVVAAQALNAIDEGVGILGSNSGFLGKLQVVAVLMKLAEVLAVATTFNLQTFLNEARDLDDEDKNKAIAAFAAALRLRSSQTERLVEAIYAGLIKGADLVGGLLSAFNPPVVHPTTPVK